MTLVTEALNRIGRLCSRVEPDSWVTATDLEYTEIREDFLVDTIDEILRRVDLPEPVGKSYLLTGTGVTEYDLPVDFHRLDRGEDAVIELSLNRQPLTPVHRQGEWQALLDYGISGIERFYRISGYPGDWQIHIFPAPTSGTRIQISYQTQFWIMGSDDSPKAEFNDAEDVLLLPRRLVETGTVARWRNRKGFDGSDQASAFELLLGQFKADAQSIRKVSMSRPQARRPWEVPVPDVIPSSS